MRDLSALARVVDAAVPRGREELAHRHDLADGGDIMTSRGLPSIENGQAGVSQY